MNYDRTWLQQMLTYSSSRANSVDDAARRQRQIEQVKIKLGMQMDEKTFLAALNESQVRSASSCIIDVFYPDFVADFVHKGTCTMAIRCSDRTCGRTFAKSVPTRRSHQGLQNYSTFDVVLPSAQPSILRYTPNEGEF